jgi:hypothetical protein
MGQEVRGDLGVQVVRDGDDRGVDAADELAVVGQGVLEAPLAGELPGALEVDVAGRHEIGDAGLVEHQHVQLGDGATADQADARASGSGQRHR